jgi:predicted nucleic acid-binding protein
VIVLDANLLVALVSGDARGDRVLKQFMEWTYRDTRLHAPILAKYEVASFHAIDRGWGI